MSKSNKILARMSLISLSYVSPSHCHLVHIPLTQSEKGGKYTHQSQTPPHTIPRPNAKRLRCLQIIIFKLFRRFMQPSLRHKVLWLLKIPWRLIRSILIHSNQRTARNPYVCNLNSFLWSEPSHIPWLWREEPEAFGQDGAQILVASYGGHCDIGSRCVGGTDGTGESGEDERVGTEIVCCACESCGCCA